MQLRVGSYNLHRCIGLDGRCLPGRIAEVIGEMDVDVVGLQEVDKRYHDVELDQVELLARATGMEVVTGPTLRSRVGHYGNVLLSRHPVGAVRNLDLSVAGREPRGAIDVDVVLGGHVVRVVVTHLGLRRTERAWQVKRILESVVHAPAGRVVVVAGDFNEWRPGDHSLRPLHARFGRSRLRTFPSRRPIFAFDRVLVDPPAALREVVVHDSPLARIASDHLPVRAIIEVPETASLAT